jgi:hypothetical protein
MFFLLQNWKQVLPGDGKGGLALVVGGSGGERGRRMNIVQIMYTHVCKCKNDTCWNCCRNQGMGDGGEKGNSSMIYLVYCKNLFKCYNVPTPSTTIKEKLEKKDFYIHSYIGNTSIIYTFLTSFFYPPSLISGHYPLVWPVFHNIAYIYIGSIFHIWVRKCSLWLSEPG